jgi:hypothetical protein
MIRLTAFLRARDFSFDQQNEIDVSVVEIIPAIGEYNGYLLSRWEFLFRKFLGNSFK